ncbi:WD40 repeat-like protein [Gloeophyllum trabeum ATCC 11539]|uniref:WD40 repeat-like protein n=1 Tax=Gloeophyllum trabeum (strain ATCC 11539 / FP-39264 / Madison 617) TaxID=670483 RepID=S7RLI7_GLOTA|nr:WD40 repeat-like protein [Gloeophyllum trabeum ATCC 11539]EPQ53524.1 WD40 repeat-like protein [Gloeophyllum trabeum ATCC 11539]
MASGIVARAWKQALRDTDRMIDEFTTKFQDLYADFRNNGILQTQLLCIRSKDDLAGMRDAIEVRDIPYAPGAGCQPSKTCLPGTREGLLSDIAQWVNGGGGGGGDKRVLLLTGGAGTGKSTVAHTVARWFRDLGRLGSSFCFSRAEAAARGPSALFGTVARDLADHVPRVRERLSTLDTAARTTRDIADQFEQFLLKPTSGLDILGPIVIVVDALDESGDVFARRPVLDIFANKSHLLPSNFRIILTSRPEQDIMAAFKHSAHVERRSMEDVQDTHQDILLYIKTQLTPGLQESDCEELAGLAGRLFQWAFVACKFITDPKPAGINYQARFHRIVPDASRKSTQTLYGLYKTVLTELFVINGMDTDEQENITRNFHSAVGPVLASYRPLSMMSLAVLLSPSGTRESIASTLGDIQCVLEFMGSLLDGVTAGTDTPIQPLHKSFYDFLTSQESAGMFFIDLPYHHGRLCQGSLFIIDTHLRFNHCKLKTSHKRNVDQEYEQPSAEIAYACQFFGSHLEQFWRSQHTSIRPPQLTHMVDDFLKKKLLCWFEILSILGRVNVARQTLLQVAKWIEPYHPGLAELAQDAAQFILYFAKPITESAPHIYLSAIPFAPEASLVAQHYQASVLNTLQVEVGKLKNWPAQQLVIQGHKSGGHEFPVRSVAFSPDDRHIASGSNDRTIRLWNAQTGEAVGEPLRGHEYSVQSVAFSPDGKHIVSGSDDSTVRVWDAQTGQAMSEPLRGHGYSVRSVAFSPDGKHIVSGSDDNTIRVWDACTGQAVGDPLKGHKASVRSVAFSPDGKHLVSGSSDKTIRLWDAETGEEIGEPLRGHESSVSSVAFSPDGKTIVSGSHDKTIRLWDAQTGDAVGEPLRGHKYSVQSVAFSPDGKHILSGMHIPDAMRVPSVAFSPDGQHIVSGSDDKTITLWDAHTGKPIGDPLKGHNDCITAVAFSPDGKYIVSGSDDCTVRVWDTLTGQAVEQFRSTSIHDDGWLISPQGDLHFWIPPLHLKGFFRAANTAVICEHPTRVAFKQFVHGDIWERCVSFA